MTVTTKNTDLTSVVVCVIRSLSVRLFAQGNRRFLGQIPSPGCVARQHIALKLRRHPHPSDRIYDRIGFDGSLPGTKSDIKYSFWEIIYEKQRTIARKIMLRMYAM